ncbi:MAG: SEC-C metal-binding domain-containing protein [Bacteroidota bacterium]
MSKRYKFYGYNLTNDPKLLVERDQIPQALEKQMENLYIKAKEGGKENIRHLKDLSKKYPDVPVLKNFLSTAYINSGMEEESYKINDRLLKEHPNYLYGILNKANEHIIKEELEKVPALMGENMELQDLFPERNIFHVSEMISFMETAIRYFIANNDIEAAVSRVDLLKEIDDQNPIVSLFETILSNLEFDNDAYPQPEFNSYDKSVQTEEPPTFQNEIIHRLYEAGFDIDQGILSEILQLPRESVIPDLQKVLRDSISRYEYFSYQDEEGNVDESSFYFPIHATFLLGEMKAYEALDDILETLRQGDAFLDFWYNDLLFQVFWQPLYKLLPENQDALEHFMIEPGVYTYAKSTVSQVYLQYYFHHPEKREEVAAWYKRVLNAYLTTDVENLVDAELIGFMVCDVIDAGFDELLPLIEQLYDAGYVDEGIVHKEELQSEIKEKTSLTSKQAVLSIFEQYDDILNNWQSDEDDDETPFDWDELDEDIEDEIDDEIDEELFQHFINTSENRSKNNNQDAFPVRKTPKIGRNEPCPCGSGKKYKKCCGKNG